MRPIDRSGYAEVWEARDDAGQRRAIKVFLHTNPEADRALHAMIGKLRRLEHAAIARVLAHATVPPDRHAMIMELVEGPLLASRIENLTDPEATLLAKQLSSALATAHGGGFAHLTLAPEEILLAPSGPKLIGFATAAAMVKPPVFGNPLYAAPEQFRERGDSRADVYALALIVFEMFAHRLPYQPSSVAEAYAAKRSPPPRLRSIRPELPQLLDDTLAAMLDPDPARRPPVDVLARL